MVATRSARAPKCLDLDDCRPLRVVAVAEPVRWRHDALVVEGNLMKPTYSSGDLIIAHVADHYLPGQIIVFKIKPPGNHARDHLIVHRLVSIAPDGRITT